MDNQLNSPSEPMPRERQGNFAPEDLQVGSRESVPQVGGGAPPPTKTSMPVQLTRDDAAAAVAAMPSSGAVPTVTSAPIAAGDVDLIEPEWVEQAEQVVRAHHGDPYGEEEAIEELQEDYLNKRYGIVVSDPNASDTKPKGA
jgi:hypothetical protein